MPFTDAFSIANPFSVNPQYSNTPQAAQAKAAQVKAHTPEASSIPKPATDENPVGAEALSAARTSPLMEAIAGYHEQETPSHSSMPQTAITNYSAGSVPNNAQTASKANANASYTDPNGNVYYYYVSSLVYV